MRVGAIRGAMELYAWIVAPWSVKKFVSTTGFLIVAVLVPTFARRLFIEKQAIGEDLTLNYIALTELLAVPFRRLPPESEIKDPVRWMQAGHCEFFASSLAIEEKLLRMCHSGD